MEEGQRAYSRLWLKTGTGFTLAETIDEVTAQIDESEWVHLTTRPGAEIFGDERIVVSRDSIAAVQELSGSSWAWQKQADTLHYTRQLQDLEASGPDRIVEVQRELLEVLKGDEE